MSDLVREKFNCYSHYSPESDWVNHYVIYSPDLQTVIKDEFWRNREALNLSIKSIVFYAKDAFILDNIGSYKVYHVGVMNRNTLEYQAFPKPDLVYDSLKDFTKQRVKEFAKASVREMVKEESQN